MAEDAWPFATRQAEEAEWREMGRLWRQTGVIEGDGNELDVQQRAAGAALQVDVQTGTAWITGHYFESDAVVEVPVPAPVANPRIDTIAVRFDFALNTRTIVRIAGAEAAAPAPPALVQNRTTKYEFPLRDVYCPVGMISVKTADDGVNGYLLADRRAYSFDHSRLCLPAPVRLATVAAMAASTVTGNARVANANGAMANIDGTAPAVGNRILDKDHATTSARGVWVIESLGSATRPWRMRRAADMDEEHELHAGAWVRVTEGATLADTGWLLTTNDPISIGVTGLTFTQFPPAGGGTSVGDLLDWQFVRKTALESVTSSTTLQNDDHLTLAIGANESWIYEFVLLVNSASDTPDIKLAVTTPAGANGWFSLVGMSAAVAGTESDVRSTTGGLNGTGLTLGVTAAETVIVVRAIVRTTGTAGSVTLQWAQSTSNGTATTVGQDSHLIGRRYA